MEKGNFNNLDDFNLPNRVWGTENNGVTSKNVSLENGIIDIKIDETNKIGGAVFKALDFVLLLRKLTLDLFFLRLQLFDFFFVHDLDLLTDKWIEKDRLRFQ